MRALVLTALTGVLTAAAPTAHERAYGGIFTGSTPCDEALRTQLAIPADARADLVEWELTLERDPQTRAPTTYHLRYAYGPAVPNLPGLGSTARRTDRRGSWRIRPHGDRAAEVLELEGAVALLAISDTVVHVLDRGGTLMAGNGGWSYTLNRRLGAEPPVDPALAAADPGDDPRTMAPLASGPSVHGVFEGRTPCQGIARELGVAARPGCWKAKWRVTLLRDPRTGDPGSYRVEGTLYSSRPRQGRWRIVRGSPENPDATVYQLAAADRDTPLFLLEGDEQVLFFLGRDRRPLTGDGRFGYTLDRRRPR